MTGLLYNIRYGKQAGYHTLFKNQDTRLVGKVGVLLGEMGMPEDYQYEFYEAYMHHVFSYSLPTFIRSMVLADRGIALIDPDNPLARLAFKPRQLIDARGSYTNRAGKPYAECNVTWRPPGVKKNPWDHGYFLYSEDGKSGSPDICQKTGAKVIGWYYGRLIPEKKVAWESQCKKIYDESTSRLKNTFPDVEFRLAKYAFLEKVQEAVEELLAAGCKTIVYQGFTNPIYTDFEEYGFILPVVHGCVNNRARVICADQLGNQPHLAAGLEHMLCDQLQKLPPNASVLVILSKHGHPFKKETSDQRAHLYRGPVEAGIRRVMAERGGRWDVLWSCDEYADEYWDPRRSKLETHAAYRTAIEQGFDYAIELPTEFPAENTDLMIFHAIKKFNAFAGYNMNEPVPYPDWEVPLVRTFQDGKTTGIYAGCLVGPYRKYYVEAVVASLTSLLTTASPN